MNYFKRICRNFLLLAGLGLGVITPLLCSASINSKPNVVIIVIDDLGWKDLACYGSKFYETPNIDKLAGQGIQFKQAYAGAANCAPSRACLISGQNTPRHGIFTVSPSDRGDARTRKLVPTPNTDFLKDECITLAEEMKSNGYATCQIGKWHVSEDPLEQGFDYNVAGGHWGHPKSYFAPYIYPTLDAPEGEYLTERLTKEAMSFIEKSKDEPFFLYLPYYSVHTPLQGKPELVEKYKARQAVDGQGNPVYAAMVEAMDENVGRVLNKLEELDLEDNTIVFFTSDNGGLRNISSQAPLRGGKGAYYEGGIRVPMIVKWPGKVPAGVKSEEPVVNLDFYPTVLDLIGAKPQNKLLDGISISNHLLKGKPLSERPFFWHFPVYLQATKQSTAEYGWRDILFRTRPGSVIRMGKWKLHEYFEDGAMELFDLDNDPGETTNLFSQYPEKVMELHRLLTDWRNETGASVPKQANPEYDADFSVNLIQKRIKNNGGNQ